MWQPKNIFKCLPSSELFLVEKDYVQRLDRAKVDEIVRAYTAKERTACVRGKPDPRR